MKKEKDKTCKYCGKEKAIKKGVLVPLGLRICTKCVDRAVGNLL